MKHLLLALFAALVLVVGPPGAMAQELNDSEEPGSVLVFHKFIRGTVFTLDQGTLPQTEIEISVTCPKGAFCPFGQRVGLRAHWVCPGPTDGGVCRETDFTLRTTVDGTLFFNPSNVEPSNTSVLRAPCPRGFLIVWAVDPDTRAAIKFDGLIGNAVLRESADSVSAYNALPIQAVSTLATGDPTGGTLAFDGLTEYKAITGKVLGTVRYERFTFVNSIQTDLTLLTLDINSNRFNNPVFVDFLFFNPDEVPFSVTHEFTCWSEVSLSEIDPGGNLIDDNMGRKGKFESVSAVDPSGGPVTLTGIITTRERALLLGPPYLTDGVDRSYSYSMFNDSTPVPTIFRPF